MKRYIAWESLKEMLDNRWICLLKGTFLLELDDTSQSVERHQDLPQDKAAFAQPTSVCPQTKFA